MLLLGLPVASFQEVGALHSILIASSQGPVLLLEPWMHLHSLLLPQGQTLTWGGIGMGTSTQLLLLPYPGQCPCQSVAPEPFSLLLFPPRAWDTYSSYRVLQHVLLTTDFSFNLTPSAFSLKKKFL